MQSIRSVLWIGRAEHFAAELASGAAGFDIVWEQEPAGARGLALEGFHAVVLDAADAAAALDGLALVGGAAAPVLVRVGPEDAARAGELLAAGAADVALRGADLADAGFLERLGALARRGTPRALPRRTRSPDPDLVGESPQMQAVFALIEVASRTRATVLVSGETGTGKEIVARAVHRGSERRGAPFVAVNCAAFPDSLLESELFGHVRGAFTGAERDRPGLFEQADGGTLFLDEVGETSAPCQAKLLRALQEREVRRVGGARAHRIDVRVIAASNRDLRREAETGAFRADLYYRLAVFPIELPPLRARPRDLPALAEHFLALHGRRDGRPGALLSPDALALLQVHSWPGNVRELENEIQRALALAAPGETLQPAHFSAHLGRGLEPVAPGLRPGASLRETMGRVEAWVIRRALASHGGRRAETARRLGITREGLYKKMRRYGIE